MGNPADFYVLHAIRLRAISQATPLHMMKKIQQHSVKSISGGDMSFKDNDVKPSDQDIFKIHCPYPNTFSTHRENRFVIKHTPQWNPYQGSQSHQPVRENNYWTFQTYLTPNVGVAAQACYHF